MIKCASLFSQILNEISSSRFAVLTEEMGNDRNAKGFTSWMQLVSMLFSHLARADSLREITNGLICCNGKIRHLGMASTKGGVKVHVLFDASYYMPSFVNSTETKLHDGAACHQMAASLITRALVRLRPEHDAASEPLLTQAITGMVG